MSIAVSRSSMNNSLELVASQYQSAMFSSLIACSERSSYLVYIRHGQDHAASSFPKYCSSKERSNSDRIIADSGSTHVVMSSNS
jgi:hypothetical protein